ncbi:MAG: glycosyltransferase [Crocinitomicaceae bacterium]|nr:glycosyltransferase [Crocinitomicaceae bacterium]MBK8925361.1 glycosyltransferase [Crocinitomicaceae bacterium]
MEKNQKKKIILLGTAHPFRGGLASYNERLALQLQQEGHDVEIFTFTVQYPGFLFPGKSQFSEEPAPANLKICRKVNSINPFNWCKIGNEIKKLKPDILLFKFWLPFMGPCFGTIARRVKKNKHTRIITILDNVIPHEHRFGDQAFTKYFLKPVDAFISMSKSVEDDLKKFDTKKPRDFNPHPLFDNFGQSMTRDEAKKLLGLDPAFQYILFFGIIRDYKGLDLLLDAYAKIKSRKKNVRLLVAGEYYSNEEKYQAQIKSLGIENEITVVNSFIKDSEVGHYFCAADIVAQPYKNATQSGVTQIAYHFEVPMLVTQVGGLPEMVPHGKVGYVVQPESTEIANALDQFFNSEDAFIFRQNLKEEKQKYTWDKLTAKIMGLN